MPDYHFEAGKFTEAELEEAILSLLNEQGWDLASGEDVARSEDVAGNTYEEVLLLPEVKQYLRNRYLDDDLTEDEIDRIVSIIRGESTANLFQASRNTFYRLIEGFSFQRDDVSLPPIHIRMIDFEDMEQNHFQAINQFTVRDAAERRPDTVLFINGIPFCICEFKSAIVEDATLYDAWEQITVRYRRDIPELLKYTSLVMLCDGPNTKLGTVFTPYEYFYAWNKANEEDTVANGISSLFTMIEGAMAPERITALLRDFVFYADGSRHETAVVCRYPQFFGARKMCDSIRKAMRPDGDGKGGTYFGATGCGKTYLMLFLSHLMMRTYTEDFGNPTIILIVDRDDLSEQASELFTTAKTFLGDDNIKKIESRADLLEQLKSRAAGGVFITTIQKFCEDIGLLSERNNIVCFSDEAHRTQTQLGTKLKKNKDGEFVQSVGYAKCLHDSFPNAVYAGFTGTPVDETIFAFGDIVDSYTMKESAADGITTRLSYEPRLAWVNLSDEQAKAIEDYYKACEKAGTPEEQIIKSKKAMSKMSAILGHPDRLKRLAKDIAQHYEKKCAESPAVVQKAMIVCSDRDIAFRLLQEIIAVRPEWGKPMKMSNEAERRAEIAEIKDDDLRSKKLVELEQELSALKELPAVNMVATRGSNDPKALYDTCGDKQYRKMLERNFKNVDSNFRIAIVVDMWITGFDVPSLAVMYIDKPIQRHSLIQTISRVNRIYPGKFRGLIVDYIGIKNEMEQALKQFGGPQESPVDRLEQSLDIVRNHLSLLHDLFVGFDAQPFFNGKPVERLRCLSEASEFIMKQKETEDEFMGLSRRLRMAYEICNPSGQLTEKESQFCSFYLAVRSVIIKLTRGDAPDTAQMNKIVENMVREALTFTGIATLISTDAVIDIDSPKFQQEIDEIKMPLSKFQALVKLLRQAIREYGKTNRIKAQEFNKMLRDVVERYNHRDKEVYSTVDDFANDLSNEVMNIMRKMKEDQESFKKEGITFEEKAFMDILIKVRDDHGFEYPEERCKDLAKKIKELVDRELDYVGWDTQESIKAALMSNIIVLLCNNQYPPEWDQEVFERVWEQAANFKKYHG